MAFLSFLTLSACIILASSLPVQNLPVLRDTPAEVLFKDGEKATLECIVDGGKDIKYSWHKNGEVFTPSTDVIQRKDVGTLDFLKPTDSDEGLYICNAVTSHGTTRTRGIWFKRAFINTSKVTVQNHKATEGRPFKLECQAPDAYPKPTISWKTQLDGSEAKDFLNQRITPSPDGNLWFSNVTQEDANPKMKYICVAKSSAFEKEVILAEHYVNQLEADTKPNNGNLVAQYVSNDMVAKVGENTMIWCIYGGTPLARPDWFKDGKNTNGDEPGSRVTRHNRSSGRRLLIKDTRLDDSGAYRCLANNMVGKPEEHTMKLTVISPPIFFKKPEKQTLVKEGQDITIPCSSTGEPAPVLTYVYNGEDLTTSSRISTGPEGITIKKVQKTDGGYYGCRMVSKYGADYLETLLAVA